MTAVEWLLFEMSKSGLLPDGIPKEMEYQAKTLEKINIDNKVIHFAEWLTNKHTTVLIVLYEQFEEQFYNKEL
jgi:hypothetical protein